jgi:hypothetical protein
MVWARWLAAALGVLTASEGGAHANGRRVALVQIALGTGLVAIGGFLAAYGDASDSLATMLIALGAVIVPPGAATAAGERLQRTRTGRGD